MESLDPDFLGSLYSSVLETNSLEGVLTNLADEFGDVIFTVQAHNTLSNENYFLAAYNADDAFFEDFWAVGHLDPLLNAISRTPFDAVFRSSDMLDSSTLEQSAFFQRLLKPRNRTNRTNGFILRKERTDVAFVAAHLPSGYGPEDEKALNHSLARLLKHAQNAFLLLLELNKQNRSTTEAGFWVSQLPTAAILVDGTARVVALNRQAEQLFSNEHGLLTTLHQKLTAQLNVHAQTLDRLVQGALLTGLAQGPEPLEKPDGKSYLVMVSPTASFNDLPLLIRPFFPVERELLITVIDPDETLPRSTELLALALGVSDREAALLQNLINGLSLKEASAELGMAYNTGRNQMASVAKKLGANSQVEAVRIGTQLLSQFPQGLADPRKI